MSSGFQTLAYDGLNPDVSQDHRQVLFGHIPSAWNMSLLPEENDGKDAKQIKVASTSVLEGPTKKPPIWSV